MRTRRNIILSAFHYKINRWVPIYPPAVPYRQEVPQVGTLSLLTWNIDFASILAIRRTAALMNYIFSTKVPVILFLQEVRPDIHTLLLQHQSIRQHFLITDTKETTFHKSRNSYSNLILLAKRRFNFWSNEGCLIQAADPTGYSVGYASREKLPSVFGRDGLFVDLIPQKAPNTYIRLINVHLDSLDHVQFRSKQLHWLANTLSDDGCSGGLIAGDFNAVTPKDDGLLPMNNIEDAWLSLHGDQHPNACTWSMPRRHGFTYPPPGRLDKVAMRGLTATKMQIIRPGTIEVPKPAGKSDFVPWSDHSGLLCYFGQ